MRTVIQRVLQANVSIGGTIHSSIDHGLLLLVAIHKDDTSKQLTWMAQKIATLRCFGDDAGKMNLSVQDVKGSLLVVSQFTLYGNCTNGRRPDFLASAPPPKAIALYDQFVVELKKLLPQVACGVFAADMQVTLTNDGPVTFVIDSPPAN